MRKCARWGWLNWGVGVSYPPPVGSTLLAVGGASDPPELYAWPLWQPPLGSTKATPLQHPRGMTAGRCANAPAGGGLTGGWVCPTPPGGFRATHAFTISRHCGPWHSARLNNNPCSGGSFLPPLKPVWPSVLAPWCFT